MKNALVFFFAIALSTAAFAQSAAQPEKLSHKQLQTLIGSARTPAEHERIAQYYQGKAQSDLAQARQHAQMAAQFKQNAVTDSPKWSYGTVNHCEYQAQSLRSEAARMEALAQKHQEMARLAGGR
jgi:hypothetical protein